MQKDLQTHLSANLHEHLKLMCSEITIQRTENTELKAIINTLKNNQGKLVENYQKYKRKNIELTAAVNQLATESGLLKNELSNLRSVIKTKHRLTSQKTDKNKDENKSSSSSMMDITVLQLELAQVQDSKKEVITNHTLEELDNQLFGSLELINPIAFKNITKRTNSVKDVELLSQNVSKGITENQSAQELQICEEIELSLIDDISKEEECLTLEIRKCPSQGCNHDLIIQSEELECRNCFEKYCVEHFPQSTMKCGCQCYLRTCQEKTILDLQNHVRTCTQHPNSFHFCLNCKKWRSLDPSSKIKCCCRDICICCNRRQQNSKSVNNVLSDVICDHDCVVCIYEDCNSVWCQKCYKFIGKQ